VLEHGARSFRDVEYHDHAAYERALETTVALLCGMAVTRPAAPRAVVETGPLVLALDDGDVLLDGRHLHLSAQEHTLLMMLGRRLGRLVLNRSIMFRLWGRSALDPPLLTGSRHAVRVLTHRLRQRLGAHGRLIVTEYDLGLKLLAEPMVGDAPEGW